MLHKNFDHAKKEEQAILKFHVIMNMMPYELVNSYWGISG